MTLAEAYKNFKSMFDKPSNKEKVPFNAIPTPSEKDPNLLVNEYNKVKDSYKNLLKRLHTA